MTRLGLVAYLVRDYDEAIRWFCDSLGFALIEDRAESGGKRWVVVAAPQGGRLLLARAANEAQAARVGDPAGGRVAFFLETDDFARDHARMTAKGVEFLESPRRENYGVVAVFKDLYGVKWDLIEPAPVA